jgi:hypothetical protein
MGLTAQFCQILDEVHEQYSNHPQHDEWKTFPMACDTKQKMRISNTKLPVQSDLSNKIQQQWALHRPK